MVYPTPRSQVLCPLPYLFGMVNNSEPSHKCHSREVCRYVGRFDRPNVSCMKKRAAEAP